MSSLSVYVAASLVVHVFAVLAAVEDDDRVRWEDPAFTLRYQEASVEPEVVDHDTSERPIEVRPFGLRIPIEACSSKHWQLHPRWCDEEYRYWVLRFWGASPSQHQATPRMPPSLLPPRHGLHARPVIDLGSVIIEGPDRLGVIRTLRQAAHTLAACAPEQPMTVTAHFSIDRAGEVTHRRAIGEGNVVYLCVERVLSTIRFPATAEPTEVSHQFTLWREPLRYGSETDDAVLVR